MWAQGSMYYMGVRSDESIRDARVDKTVMRPFVKIF